MTKGKQSNTKMIDFLRSISFKPRSAPLHDNNTQHFARLKPLARPATTISAEDLQLVRSAN